MACHLIIYIGNSDTSSKDFIINIVCQKIQFVIMTFLKDLVFLTLQWNVIYNSLNILIVIFLPFTV